MCIEDADFGAYVEYEDYVALETECDSLWSTYVALVDKLGIDTEKAKTADGKPSDVIISYVDALRAENDRLRDALEEIADPIKFMRARLEDGEQLNGVYAIQMAESGNYLREIAKRALTASTEQEVEK
jgi:hypothetical protein